MNDLEPAYSVKQTATKAAIPLGVIAGVETVAAVLPLVNVNIDKATLYTIGVGVYSAIVAISNWLKNRHK
jgi:ABC-type enterobactin transport system permease subunit